DPAPHEPLHVFLAEQERLGRAERLRLRPFDQYELGEQIESILGHTPEAALARRIWERSGGNAFYAEELLTEDSAEGFEAPLREVLLARLGGLSEVADELVRAASAAGPVLRSDLLAAVLGREESDLGHSIREAIGRQVLEPAAAGSMGTLRFRHA